MCTHFYIYSKNSHTIETIFGIYSFILGIHILELYLLYVSPGPPIVIVPKEYHLPDSWQKMGEESANVVCV